MSKKQPDKSITIEEVGVPPPTEAQAAVNELALDTLFSWLYQRGLQVLAKQGEAEAGEPLA